MVLLLSEKTPLGTVCHAHCILLGTLRNAVLHSVSRFKRCILEPMKSTNQLKTFNSSATHYYISYYCYDFLCIDLFIYVFISLSIY